MIPGFHNLLNPCALQFINSYFLDPNCAYLKICKKVISEESSPLVSRFARDS